MAVVALTNIYDGMKSYAPGEVIEGLAEEEEQRLIKLKYANPVQSGEPPRKVIKKKS